MFKYVLLCAYSDYDLSGDLSGKVDQCKKCHKKICNISIFDEVDFSSFVVCTIMKKGLKPVSSYWKHEAFFVAGLDTIGKLCAKYQLCYIFFPQKM